jgi:hypothetical protein
MGRFVDYLKEHGRLSDLAFVSFEHYPFHACKITWETLYSEPQLMKHILQVWRDDGVPQDVPLMVTESHLAASLSGPMSTIFAGLWLADNVGRFLKVEALPFTTHPFSPRASKTPVSVAVVEFCVRRKLRSGYHLFTMPHMINLRGHRSSYTRCSQPLAMLKMGREPAVTSRCPPADGNWSLMLVNRDQIQSARSACGFRK